MKVNPPVPFTRTEKILILALALFQFIYIVDFMILMPLGPTLIEKFNITNQEFSYLVSAYTFAAGASALLASTVIDRFHRKKALMAIFAAFLGGTLLCGLSESYGLLLGARLATGAFGGLINGLIMAIIGDSFPYEKRGAAMGTVIAAFSAASVVGVPLGLAAAEHWSWNVPFTGLFGVGILFLLFAFYAIPITPKVAREHAYGDLFRHKNHYVAFFLTFCMMMTGFSMIPYISNYFVFNTGLKTDQIFYIYLTGGLATFFSARIIGSLADRIGKKKTFYGIAFTAIIPILWIAHLEESSLGVTLLVSTLYFVLVSGRVVPAMALITSAVKPAMRGSFMTLNTSIQQFSSATATLIGGQIIATTSDGKIENYEIVSYLAVVFLLLSIYMVYRIQPVDGAEPSEEKID